MQVGWGGNNGSTVTATVLANKHKLSWKTKGEIHQSFPIFNIDLIASDLTNADGVKSANYFGSITQSSTVLVGSDSTTGEEVFVPMKNILPMVMNGL